MKFVKVNPKLRFAGKGQDNKPVMLTTYEVLATIVRSGKKLNTGTTVIDAKAIVDATNEAKKEDKKYISIEDAHHTILMEDLKEINFSQINLSGISIAEDIENIRDAVNKKPDDFDEKIKFIFPDFSFYQSSEDTAMDLSDIPEDAEFFGKDENIKKY